ncbi:GntR family transcriptional regulator/MocR family aminotransferase [Variovorax boronicumulans]|uniref:GntR family transcriptional regulator/MocR family aminotransferase n=1 Tax=Variovorax boronicumulans TaxID=436515 RepID=A0AAW8E186_9BURK|nr:PLP-dependent aminotransferase family protein [Variovorax boronicumulans]MDP9879815.1 GntR family transcriptional regulator/MocR family aminotransferase [Variovorax boronicumulans]MDP9914743.1 GntR family transcriptional regulator/MocR family aminotransferase [Variovorax boronicumulans]MDP9925461.1 GntR family transcriptional regulator/MocR family aminotransferase [Variovorax boronicumulans]
MEPLFELALRLPAAGSRDLLRALHRQLRDAILDGRLQPGARLPATRALAQRLGVSRNTMLAAYDLLLSEGYLLARPGSGTFVADTLPALRRGRAGPKEAGTAPRRDPRLVPLNVPGADLALTLQPRAARDDFRVGLPDVGAFPFDIWRRLSDRALRRVARQTADYADPQGQGALREAIAAHVSFTRAVGCTADDIVVTAGAQQAFGLLARILVVPGRTVVAVEQLFYPSLREAMLAAGAKVVTVPTDDEGLCVDRIPPEARVVCVTPSHQFPTGVAMSPPRRAALLAFARARNAVLIEDDYDSEFRFAGRPLDALQTLDRAGSVFYVGTFSKSLFPALRLGFVVAPPWARAALVRARELADWHGPVLGQEALAAFIAEGHLARHIRRMRKLYGARRSALLDALARHGAGRLEAIPSDAGLHLSAWLHGGARDHAVVERAAAAGITLPPLSRFALDPQAPEAPNGLAFGFGLIAEPQIDGAIRRLVRLL